MRISQYSETDTLESVVIGRYENYCKVPAYIQEGVNEKQKHEERPSKEDLEREFEALREVLTLNRVEVLEPQPVGKFVYDQLTPRDIGMVIGDKFLICNMTNWSRRYECAGIFETIKTEVDKEPNIIIPDTRDCFIEGGDLLLDKGNLFVGLSERTNQNGVEFLKTRFGQTFNIVPIKVPEKLLHLDCIFNPIGENSALIYEEGFDTIPKEIIDSYDFLIEVDERQQEALATNVLSISKTKVISRDHIYCKEVNEKIKNGKEKGIEVIELPFNAAPRTGGSFRCCSLPLTRSEGM